MLDFIEDLIDSIFDSGISDDVIDPIDDIDVSVLDVTSDMTDEIPSDISESNVAFQGGPSRTGRCYDCECIAFIPKPGQPTTCICGHSIGRHHLY